MSERGLAGYAGSYSPSTPGDWATPAPRTIQDALDRLANASAGSPIVDIVRSFHVDNTGATNAGPATQAAFDSCAALGFVPYFPAGLYHYDTGLIPPSNLTVMMSGEAVIDCHIGTGPFDPTGVWLVSIPTVVGTPTTLTAIAHAGTFDLDVVDATGIAINNEVIVTIGGSGAAFVGTVADVGGTTVSMALPFDVDWPIGATVQVVSSRLKNFRLFGNGATVQGAAGRLFELSTCSNCIVDNLTLIPTTAPAWSASFDTGSDNCMWSRITTIGEKQGLALEGNRNSLIWNCTHEMFGNDAVIAFTMNDCVQCDALECFAYGQEKSGQVGVSLGANPGSFNVGCTVEGGAVVGFETGVSMSAVTSAVVSRVRPVGCSTGIDVGTFCKSVRVENCDVSGNNILGIGVLDTAKGTVVVAPDLSSGPQTIAGLFCLGDCVVIAPVSRNAPSLAAFGNCTIKAQQNSGASYIPIVEVIGGDLVLDANAGNNTACIGAFGAKMKISGVHYDLNQAGARGFEAVDGQQGAHSNVTHSDCTFTGTAALDAIVVGAASTVRYPRNLLGGFSVTVQAGAFTDRGSVIANGATGVDVNWPALEPGDRVLLTMAAKGGAPSAQPLVTYTPGTKFTVASFAGDTSTYDYVVA